MVLDSVSNHITYCVTTAVSPTARQPDGGVSWVRQSTQNLSILCRALKVMSLASGHPPWPVEFRNPEAVF